MVIDREEGEMGLPPLLLNHVIDCCCLELTLDLSLCSDGLSLGVNFLC